jgi:mono/diheme cytochrome c family protein
VRGALAVAAAATLAGCGGGGDGAESSRPLTGAQVFAEQGCGSCHVLAAAGATGTVGPSLDARALSAGEVERWVRRGGKGMPALDGLIDDAEIVAVSRYVARESRARR